MSADQILLIRRFASGFMYKTDATFNTNKLRLLLSVIVRINNTGKTFPLAFMYHTTKSAKAFKFASDQLTDLAFYNCLKPAVIYRDFSKGLGAAIKLKAFQDARQEAEPEQDFLNQGVWLTSTKTQLLLKLQLVRRVRLHFCSFANSTLLRRSKSM
jgi:hypothetical protein